MSKRSRNRKAVPMRNAALRAAIDEAVAHAMLDFIPDPDGRWSFRIEEIEYSSHGAEVSITVGVRHKEPGPLEAEMVGVIVGVFEIFPELHRHIYGWLAGCSQGVG